ncbi:MAG: hypothetical protein LC795_15670 [Acidobacteria bacterium]|nr:hypothetical protein [Acidobacteriota bacterium]MCA1620714.1 hypothetical protein [Acidobacteriota bacterium]
MDLILRPSGGQNIVLRPQARPTWYPAPTVDAYEVEVWMQEIDPDTGALLDSPRLLGRFPAVGEFSFPYTPHSDRDVRLYFMPYAADGTPGFPDLRSATQITVLFRRETDAPVIGQVGDATADTVTLGVGGFSEFVRRRRIRIAESLDGGGALVSPVEVLVEEDANPRALYIDISRTGNFTPAFSWAGGDPAAGGFTKVGSGVAESAGTGWRVSTTGADSATYYTKDVWPAAPFAAGFTLELDPPPVAQTDAGAPSQAVAVRAEDGARRYELRFDGDEVSLNGGAAHAHGGLKVRLVVAVGGLTADLWVGDALAEDNAAGAATATSGLWFGDLAGADDSDATWQNLSYALTPVPTRLAQTIYVTVAHSSGVAWGAESNVLEVTFANEGSGDGGSAGDFDPIPRNEYEISTL